MRGCLWDMRGVGGGRGKRTEGCEAIGLAQVPAALGPAV